jgi:hypothetical protein
VGSYGFRVKHFSYTGYFRLVGDQQQKPRDGDGIDKEKAEADVSPVGS